MHQALVARGKALAQAPGLRGIAALGEAESRPIQQVADRPTFQ